MEWVLVVLAVAVVAVTALYLGRRRPPESRPDELPDGPLDRGRIDGPDARGAISKHSWMLGGGST